MKEGNNGVRGILGEIGGKFRSSRSSKVAVMKLDWWDKCPNKSIFERCQWNHIVNPKFYSF